VSLQKPQQSVTLAEDVKQNESALAELAPLIDRIGRIDLHLTQRDRFDLVP
jgi:hypothetical protein